MSEKSIKRRENDIEKWSIRLKRKRSNLKV